VRREVPGAPPARLLHRAQVVLPVQATAAPHRQAAPQAVHRRAIQAQEAARLTVALAAVRRPAIRPLVAVHRPAGPAAVRPAAIPAPGAFRPSPLGSIFAPSLT